MLIFELPCLPSLCTPYEEGSSVKVCELKNFLRFSQGFAGDDNFYLLAGSRVLRSESEEVVVAGVTIVRVLFRLRGGKGGFGALLRGSTVKIGAKRTDNFSAMRDLSGRRMRHVEAEEKLAEWLKTEHKKDQKSINDKYKRINEGRATEMKMCKYMGKVSFG